MNLSVIVVNWNGGDSISKLFDSLRESIFSGKLQIIFVDNNSSDESLEFLKNINDKFVNVSVIFNKENLGFGKACNLGAALSNQRTILFLNPDTVLEKNSIHEALKVYESKEDVGILGVKLIDEQGNVSRNCSRFPTPFRIFLKTSGLDRITIFKKHSINMHDFAHDEDQYVDQIIGAFFMINTDLFLKSGGFDDQFFMYYEEVDLAYRINNAGLRSFFLSTVQAMHVGGGSSSKVSDKRLSYSVRSRIQYAKKHFNTFGYICVLLTSTAVEPTARIMRCLIFSKHRDEFIPTLKAYQHLFETTLKNGIFGSSKI